jgi:hypothetical protein
MIVGQGADLAESKIAEQQHHWTYIGYASHKQHSTDKPGEKPSRFREYQYRKNQQSEHRQAQHTLGFKIESVVFIFAAPDV